MNEKILKALDSMEDLRQQFLEGSATDYDFRVVAADIASIFDDPELHDRATWCDLLKADTNSLYHKRYYHGTFH